MCNKDMRGIGAKESVSYEIESMGWFTKIGNNNNNSNDWVQPNFF